MEEIYPRVPEVVCYCNDKNERQDTLCTQCEWWQVWFTKQYADLLDETNRIQTQDTSTSQETAVYGTQTVENDYGLE